MKSFLSIFFLLNTILSSINFLSTKSTTSALAPFIIVVVIGLVLDGIEEIKRYRNDVKANNTKVKIYKNKKFRNIEWSKVKIGNLVKVKKDENFPADMLVIFSSNIDDILIEERYILAYFTDDKFQSLLYEKARNYYEYYKKKILDED